MEDTNKVEESNNKPDNHNNTKMKNSFNRCESLEEGTFAFMRWLNSEDKRSLSEEKSYSIIEIYQ